MCGLTGIIHSNQSTYIENMTDVIAHRGPDDVGYYTDANISLGHRRLSIQDLSPNGHQPMWSNDGNVCVVFNGEIYNHLEIRAQLQTDHEFKSSGDTETVLYAYLEYGTDVFNILNGIFALAIYHKDSNKLILARDHFGIKPLYYQQHNDVFLFSSEIKAIIQHPAFNQNIDTTALANYLSFLYSPGEKTPFINVKKLLPGHFIIFENGNSIITKYYELPFTGKYALHSEEEWIDLLEEKLTNAVKRQLLSDVPVGFFLSGGLDSSLIVAIAKKILPDNRLKCFTIETATDSEREGFVEDLPYAKKVAKHLDVDLEIIQADIDILRDFDKMIYHLDEPQADAAPLNVMNICKKAREQGVVVLLGGTAGDDLFSGYRRHQAVYYSDKLKFIPNFIKRTIYHLSTLLPKDKAFSRRAQKLLSQYKETTTERQFASLYAWLSDDKVKKLFKEKIDFKPVDYLIESLKNIPEEKSLLNKLLYWDMKYFLTDHNLNYTDKMSMAHGVEVRVPFLDVELVEFSTTIPPELKMKGIETKYLLKKVAERYLPKEVIYRPKSGFGAPVRDWVINDLEPMINEYLSREIIEKRAIFNYSEVKQLIENNISGKIDASYTIWALLAIESWIRQFVDPYKQNSIS